MHWGDATLNRKANVTAQISNYSVVGVGPVYTYNPDPRPLSWTDGAPAASSSTDKNGLYINGIGNGFSFTVPADTTTRVVTVHVGAWNSGATLTAHSSDGSGADFIDIVPNTAGQYDRNYTLTYAAANSGQTLTVSWTMTSGTGNVTIGGAALSGQAVGGGGNGSISGLGDSSTAADSLTADGGTDWVHWGDGIVNRKAGVAPQINGFGVVGAGNPVAYNPDLRPLSWTDGAPTSSSATTKTGSISAAWGTAFPLPPLPMQPLERSRFTWEGGTVVAHSRRGASFRWIGC